MGTMYTLSFLFAALIFSGSSHPAAPKSIAIVERVRSELRSTIEHGTSVADDMRLERWSTCWWLWMLSGSDVCRSFTPNAPARSAQQRWINLP